MLLSSPHLKAVVCLLLCSNLASAGLLRFRADTTTTTPVATSLAASTTAADATTTTADTTTKSAGGDGTGTITNPPASTAAATETATTTTNSSATVSSIQATGTLANGTSSLNTTLFNTTIPAGQLPIQPVVTPAWGVAGALMLLTGVVYTLVGIRNRLLQTFFSTAYLCSLGTTVLIIYVMSPPISNAVQGAYMVAAVCTGLILGGIAIVFKEITEGFGCLLGGFSLSMWLLCLRQGGLVQSTSGIIIFIVAFTAGAYIFYFSHFTRHYAIMAGIAFGGATVTVLGIDAFSRAGLKEFWAYIWNINGDVFSLGTVTYPLTKGIRVELAAIILLFFAGVVSQLKLWRLVQERRDKREAERAEDELKLQKEEENVGRQIEESNARERQEWEAVYGDGASANPPPQSPGENNSGDSGVGDMESEKQMARSQATSISRQSRQGGVASSSDGELGDESESMEMANMQSSPQPAAAAEMVMAQDEKDGAIMVRVAQDEYPEGLSPNASEQSGANASSSRRSSRRVSAPISERRLSKNVATASGAPGIVPLPFTVPTGRDDGDDIDERDHDDRSSVATFADEDEVIPKTSRNRTTLAKRLSQSSADLFRSLSQRSKRASAVLDKPQHNINGQSKEELVSPRSSRMAYREDDDNSSLAATMDGMSSDEDDCGTIRDGETGDKSKEIEVKPQLSSTIQDVDVVDLTPPKKLADDSRHMSTATVSTDILGLPSSTSTDTKASASDATEKPPQTPTVNNEGQVSLSNDIAKSAVSVDSAPANLTKERLPRSLSRVAMSYRTNEWAKHLSNAETPEFESLRLGEPQQPPSPTTSTNSKEASTAEATSPAIGDGEAPVPLNVTELQQTAETGAPAPLAPRSASAMSYAALSPSNSRQSMSPQEAASGARNSYMSSSGSIPGNGLSNGYRSMSASQLPTRGLGLHNEPIAEENDTVEAGANTEGYVSGPSPDLAERDSSGADASPFSNRGSLPPVPGVVSYNAPQTLIGQRDMLLRSKSQQGLYIGGPIATSASMASLTGIGNNGSTMFPVIPSSGASDSGSGSVYNYYPGGGQTAAVAAGSSPTVDLDDLPMNQRKELMRNSSLMSLSRPPSVAAGYFGQSHGVPASMSTPAIATPTAGSVPFNSHQPKRDQAHLPTAAARQAQLATFRNSVAADLRLGAPAVAGAKNSRESMSTPFLNTFASTSSLAASPYARETEVQQSIDMQRSFLMSQKEAEAQRRGMERLEKERAVRAFEERMRRGDLLEAHRDAMRRMQASARE